MEDGGGGAAQDLMQFLCLQTKACNRMPLTQFPFSPRDAFASFGPLTTRAFQL